jgi:hypothetical protein
MPHPQCGSLLEEAHIHPDAEKDHYREEFPVVEVDEVAGQIKAHRDEAEGRDS